MACVQAFPRLLSHPPLRGREAAAGSPFNLPRKGGENPLRTTPLRGRLKENSAEMGCSFRSILRTSFKASSFCFAFPSLIRTFAQHRSLSQSRALHLRHRPPRRHRRERRPGQRGTQHPPHHGTEATEGDDLQALDKGLVYKNNKLNGFNL